MATNNNDWVSWALGIASGVGLWLWLKPVQKKSPGVTTAAEMPKVASPSRFANLESVANRFDEVKTLYRSGRLTPKQALAEADGLLVAAKSFQESLADRTKAVLLEGDIALFMAEIVDYMDMQRAGTVGNSPA